MSYFVYSSIYFDASPNLSILKETKWIQIPRKEKLLLTSGFSLALNGLHMKTLQITQWGSLTMWGQVFL